MTRPNETQRGYLAMWALAAAAIALLVWSFTAEAHEALPTASQPNGWQYGYECCSQIDCRQVQDSVIEEGPDGYHITLNGETIPYGDKRIKKSKDEFYHLCTIAGKDTGRTICLYEPQRLF